MLRVVLSFVIVLHCSPILAQQTGIVAEVISGDSFRLDNGTLVRLAGIDAPEPGGGPGSFGCNGRKAREFLAELILNQEVVLTPDTMIERGMAAAAMPDWPYSYVVLDTIDVNRRMVLAGYSIARLTLPFESQANYIQAELVARQQGFGMWGRQDGYQPCDRLCVSEPVDTSDWVEYLDRRHGYRLLIPRGTDVDSTDRGIWLRWPDRSPHINALAIEVDDAGHHACRPCELPEPTAEKQPDVKQVLVNGIQFCRRHWCEGATGTVYEVTEYTIERAGRCFRVSYTFRFTNPSFYLPHAAPSFDREAEAALLERVVASFRFVE